MTETVQMNQTGHRSKIFIGAFIAMLIGSAILLLTLFMPFASATDEYKEALEKFSDSMYIEELNMTNKEAINISDCSICRFCIINIIIFNIKKINTRDCF